jgi:two-component system, OmpR family, sensor histidine kinase VicK
LNSSHSSPSENKTEVLHGDENILKSTLEITSDIKHSIDNCIDSSAPLSFVSKDLPMFKALSEARKKGIKSRFITEIKKNNIVYCKELMKIVELRHLDKIKGNFGIIDGKDYRASSSIIEGRPPSELIVSTVKTFVEQQQFFFDMLWDKAVPAEQRILEIEEGLIPDILEMLKNPSEIIKVGYRLVKAARDEILIIFHTANALLRQDRAGGVKLLAENVVKYKTRVSILVPIVDKITDTIQRLEQIDGIEIRNIEPTMQTRMTILVVDKKYSLVVELKDDTKDNFEEAIGLATYSNSKSTVLSYVSIFDTLWKQSELREELLVHSMAQKEFINIAAHELRNPIQPILGLSDVLLRSDIFLESDKKNESKQKEIIEIIARNAKRLQRLTEDILDVTKIDSKTLKPNKQSFVLAETIREMVQEYSSEIRNNGKNVILSFSSSSEELESTPIIADENRIKQVICNLIDNAIKFTQKGEIIIATEIDNKHNQVIVKVKDTGTGIDSDILPKLFTKFATKSERGTGLGLYICKGIIEAHNGRIWAENNSDRNSMNIHGSGSGGGGGGGDEMRNGATFSFSLPLTHFDLLTS